MSDVTLSYKGSDILELSDSGSATLKTGGKYCEDDIAVEYVKPSGGGISPFVAVVGEVTPISDSTSMGFPTDGKFANVSDILMFFAYVDDYTQYTDQNNMIVGGYKFNSRIKTPTGTVAASTVQTIDTSKTPPINYWSTLISESISGNSYVISNNRGLQFKSGVKYRYILVGVES